MEENYAEPNKNNVKKGAFLYTEINRKVIHLPITEVKENVVIATNDEDTLTCDYPYSQAVIKSDGELLVGRKVERSQLSRILSAI